MRSAQESFGVNVDALGAVFRQSHGDRVALPETTGFDDLEIVASLDDDTIHARTPRQHPAVAHPHIGREVRGGEESFGQDSVGGNRLE
jgi:hypothetical protein